jgi:TatD DNase family protein
MLIDTHCHLDFDRFDPDRDEVIARAAAVGVTRIIVPAVDGANFAAVLRLTEQYKGIYAAIGVHPNSSAKWRDVWAEEMRPFAEQEKVVAIGEIGLDYYRTWSPKATQKRAFAAQLQLAHDLNLPVIVHNRESDDDVVQMLRESPLNGKDRPGVLHSFSTTWEIAKQVLDMGFYLGFTGPLTFKQADELRRVAARVPLDRLLVETDAPYLAPQQKRGQRNEPAYVAYVAERLAAVRNMDAAALYQQTTDNAIRLFGNKLKL